MFLASPGRSVFSLLRLVARFRRLVLLALGVGVVLLYVYAGRLTLDACLDRVQAHVDRQLELISGDAPRS